MSDYKNQLVYTQEAMDMAISKAILKGSLQQFVIDQEGNADLSKIKEFAEFLHEALAKYGPQLPSEDAQFAASFLDSALEFFMKKL